MTMILTDLDERDRVAYARKRFQKRPRRFFKNVLGVETLEDYQKEVISTVAANSRTAISACHDVGKSFLMARIAIWFLNSFPNSKVITTAPTYNQVERILWSELRAAHAKAKFPLGGKLNNTDWTFNPEWFALGFSPQKSASAGTAEGQGTQSSFQGFHAEHLMVIFDEATGIPSSIWTMAEGLLTSGSVKFVAIGNPTSASSDFAKCFKDPAWAKIKLNCFNSPNLIANGITDKDKLIAEVQKVRAMSEVDARAYLETYKVPKGYLLTTKWVVEQTRKWGIDHPLTVSKILGEFPESGDHVLIPLGGVEQAQIREYVPVQSDRKVIGVDVARFGTDSTVVTTLHGKKQLARKEFFQRRNTEVAGEVISIYKAMGGADVIVIDETGLGSGVVDNLVEAQTTGIISYKTEIRGVQFGSNAFEDEADKEKYVNFKAKMFGLLADDIAASDGLSLLDETVYVDELPTIRKRYNSKGQLVIESKDDYKKRTGRSSPDNSDSLALANYGRYAELKVGAFTSSFSTDETRTYSGGLRQDRNW